MSAFLDVSALKERIEELTAKAEAIYDLAKDENRELTDQESAELEEIQGKDGSGGLLAKHVADLKSKQAIEARTAAKLQAKINSGELSVPADASPQKPAIAIPARARSVVPLRAYSDEKDAYVAGHVFLANLYNKESSREWLRTHGFSNVMSTNDNSTGGFLTTTEMSTAIIRMREEMGVFPRFARRWPMGADTMTVPRLLSDTTGYWVGENTEITASDIGLGEMELSCRKLGSLTKMPTELDEDAVVEVGDLITTAISYNHANKLDDAGFNGDGTSTYGQIVGLKNALTAADPAAGGAGAVVVAETGNDAANNLDLLDFEKTIGALPNYPGIQPRWFMSKPVFYASWCRLANAGGGNTNETLSGMVEPTIMGYPVTFVSVMDKTTSTNASAIIAYFGDLSLAASYGVRRAAQVQVSTERYFETDQIGIKMTERVGITVHERGDDIRQRPILALKTAA